MNCAKCEELAGQSTTRLTNCRHIWILGSSHTVKNTFLLITQAVRDSLNAKPISSVYAGAVNDLGIEFHMNKAHRLARKLSSK